MTGIIQQNSLSLLERKREKKEEVKEQYIIVYSYRFGLPIQSFSNENAKKYCCACVCVCVCFVCVLVRKNRIDRKRNKSINKSSLVKTPR